MNPTLREVVEHVRNRSYMSGVQRDALRIKATGEIFTPTPLVQELLDQLPIESFSDPSKTFLDPSCGDGQFLGEVLIRKLEHGITFAEALNTIYGVELMPDNRVLCVERLLCGHEEYRDLVESHVVCADALIYDYSFGDTTGTLGSYL